MSAQIFSTREQRWVADMPVPYPPTVWDRILHFFQDLYWPHSIKAIDTCRVCQEIEWQSFRWRHSQEPK